MNEELYLLTQMTTDIKEKSLGAGDGAHVLHHFGSNSKPRSREVVRDATREVGPPI